jgi:hypothetical protein
MGGKEKKKKKKKEKKKRVFLLIFSFHIKRNIHVPQFTLGKKTLKCQKIRPRGQTK